KRSINKYGRLIGNISHYRPWNVVAIDIIGPLSNEGEKAVYILHMMDMASKFSITMENEETNRERGLYDP
ncbi:hypothetical protein M153_23346000586, partial [Pseudoloma neurophilia]